MKKIISPSVLWLTSVAAQGQYKDPLIIANTDYLELSKKQKESGWICIGVSVVLITSAILLPTEIKNLEFYNDLNIPGSLFITGLLGIPMGVTELALSLRNKRKGINLLLRKETVRQLQNNKFSNADIPDLRLKISL